jgi:hypothetical protein
MPFAGKEKSRAIEMILTFSNSLPKKQSFYYEEVAKLGGQ